MHFETENLVETTMREDMLMSDIENAADDTRFKDSTNTRASEPQKLPGQVLSIVFDQEMQSSASDLERIVAADLAPWDLILPVGSDRFLILFDRDDVDTAASKHKILTQRIEAADIGPFQSQLVDIRPRGGKLVRTFIGESAAPAHGQSAETENEISVKSTICADGNTDYEVGYAPMWNIRNEVLMGYAVLPVIRNAQEGDLYGRQVLGASNHPEQLDALDTQMLKTQIETAETLLPKNFTSLLVSQIHFDTLSSSTSRKTILEIAKKIPPYMKGNLMASIVDIPSSTPSSTLAQRISGLSEYFRAVSITIPSSDFPIAPCAAMGATSVSYRIPADLSNAAIVAEARKIIGAAKSAKLLTVFEEVSDLNLAVALKKLGGVFITGTCLGGIEQTPGNMKQLTVKDLQDRSQAA